MFRQDLFEDKRFLVTGGGTGLGRAMSERLLDLGADIAICGRRKGVLDEAAAEMMEQSRGQVSTHGVDIRDADAVETMIDEVWADGPLDGLINNAAGNFISRTEDLSANGFDAITNIVLHGTFYVTNACGKRWIAGGLKASVVSIVVTWVWTGSPYVVPSAMAKSGVAAMTRSLAVEWGAKGIRLNAIAPGPFPTKGAWDRLHPDGDRRRIEDGVPMKRVGRHRELADFAAFLLADDVEFLTGQVIAIDGGQHLNNAATFSMLESLSDDDWRAARAAIKATNEADKAKRGAG